MLFSTENSAIPLYTVQNMYSFKMLLKKPATTPAIHLHESFNVQSTSSQHCIIRSSGKELNGSTAISMLCFKTHFMSLTAVCYSRRQFPQHVQNNPQANTPQPAMGIGTNHYTVNMTTDTCACSVKQLPKLEVKCQYQA